jgi:ribosome-associated protein
VPTGVDRFGWAAYNFAVGTEAKQLSPVDVARLVVDAASDKLATDIVMLDLRGISDFADFFVIMTAESARQMGSLAEDLEDALELAGVRRHHREGTPAGGWMLLDFGDVIAHLFTPEKREFYLLEEAWSQATETVRIQ